jgi:hypothetical protein
MVDNNIRDKESLLEINYYIVAFIDILGQQDALKKFKGLPNDNSRKEKDEFLAIVKSTFGVINNFSLTFKSYFDEFMKMQNMPSLNYKVQSNDIKFQRFSDCLVIFLSLSKDEKSFPIVGIYGILAACAGIFPLWLSIGHPLRGGIEIGMGAEIYENEIYGLVVSEAYNLENKIAQYPRIVVGEKLKRYLFDHAKNETSESDFHTKLTRELAKICMGLLTQDDDGYAIVDYLGEGSKKVFYKEIENEHIVQKAYDFVIEQFDKWQQNKDSKLAFRYTLLRNYFEARLPLWIDKENHS